MLFNTVRNQLKKSGYILTLSCFCSTFAFAASIECSNHNIELGKLCSKKYDEQRAQLNTKFLTAYLVTDAPLQLLHDTQTLWLNQIRLCKTKSCFQQQFDARIDDLNFFTSMNQTLTQHYLKYEHGKIAKQPVHLKVHQLDKDKLKIEGLAYRNPNNRIETQTISLLSYSTPSEKNEIIDNEKNASINLTIKKHCWL